MAKKIKENPVIKKAKEIEWREVDNEALLLKIKTATFYKLNETATLVWKSINGKRKESDFVKIIIKNFDVSKERAEKDLKTLLSFMKKNCLIE